MSDGQWLPLQVDGAWNPKLRERFDNASGAYAIRFIQSGKVEYVGESHTGRGWTTLVRHFQDASGKFAARNQRRGGSGKPTWTRKNAGLYQAALWVTSRGPRTKANSDEKAMAKQAELIARWSPEAFSRNPRAAKEKNPSPKKGAGRWTIFTKGDDVAFSGTKHGAQAAAQVIADRQGASVYLATEGGDDRGERIDPKDKNPSAKQKNPSPPGALVVLGWLVSIVYMEGGRRRVLHFGPRVNPAILAYRPGGAPASCVIVHRPMIAGASSTKGQTEYKRTHWGKPGTGEKLTGQMLGGPAKVLGPATEITYATEKGGDAELVDYVHTFGDYGDLTIAKKRFVPPIVQAATVKGRQLVRLVGGSYVVLDHGIVG